LEVRKYGEYFNRFELWIGGMYWKLFGFFKSFLYSFNNFSVPPLALAFLFAFLFTRIANSMEGKWGLSKRTKFTWTLDVRVLFSC